MSAFICSKFHIDCVVSYAVAKQVQFRLNGTLFAVEPMHANTLGKLLMLANVASVDYRYRESNATDEADAYTWERVDNIGDAAAHSLAACLDYQCCEVPDWDTRPAKLFLDAFKAATGHTSESARRVAPNVWEARRDNRAELAK